MSIYNKETITSLIKELETKESARQEELKKEFEDVKASIKSIDTKFSKSHEEIKQLINDLSEQSDEETKELLNTLEIMENGLTELENNNLTQINDKLVNMESMYSELMSNLEIIMEQDFNKLNETISNKYDELNSTVTNKYDELNSTVNNKFDSLSISFESGNEDVIEELSKINSNIEKVFQYVSDGKRLIASAITDKGIGSSQDAEFAKFASLITMIGSDVIDLNSSRILEGTRVYDGKNNVYVDGTMPNRGAQEDFNPSGIAQKTYESGYYPSSWTVDTTNAYNKGYSDGKADVPNAKISYIYHEHKLNDGTVKEASYKSSTKDGCFSKEIYHEHTGDATNGGGCYTTPVYHKHSGSSTSGGGCYTVAHTGTKQEGCSGGAYCSQGPFGPDTSGQVYYVATCPVCLAHLSVYNSPGYASCPNSKTVSYTYYTTGCGKSESTIVGYNPGCGLAGTVDHYELGCGKTDYATAGEDATIASATIVYE